MLTQDRRKNIENGVHGVSCIYPGSRKAYTFIIPRELRYTAVKGAYLIVKSANGLNIVKITKQLAAATLDDYNFSNTHIKLSWGFQVVDMAFLKELEALK